MLDKIPNDTLVIILRYAKTRTRIMRVALTCKRLYTFCRDTKKIWPKHISYDKFKKSSIGIDEIKKITINGRGKIDALKRIQERSKSVDHIRLYYNLGEHLYNYTNLSKHIWKNITTLELRFNEPIYLWNVICIVQMDTLVSITISPKYISKDNVNAPLLRSHCIGSIGKSIKRLSIIKYTNLKNRFDIEIDDGKEGLQIVELYEQFHLSDKIYKDNAETIRAINIYQDSGFADQYDVLKYLVNLEMLQVENYGLIRNTIPKKYLRNCKKLWFLKAPVRSTNPDVFANIDSLRMLRLHVDFGINVNLDSLINITHLEIVICKIEFYALLHLRNLVYLAYGWYYFAKIEYVDCIEEICHRFRLNSDLVIASFPILKKVIL
jgi:hypothetical protein